MRIIPRLLAVLCALLVQGAWLAAGPELAGKYFFKTYGSEQGFTQSALLALVQDSAGFIWIGTENGLVRYDGTAFRKWTELDGLPSATIENLEAIPGGGLWVATRRGLVRFQDGRATPLLLDGKVMQLRGQLMHLGSDGSLWVLREDGLFRIRDGRAERIPGRPEGWGKGLATRESTGSVFMAVADGLWERRRDGSVVRLAYPKGQPKDSIQALAVDGRGRLWVAGVNSLRYQDPLESGFHDVSSWLPAGPFLGCIIKTNPDGSVAIPTNAGLLRLNGDQHEFLGQDQGLPGKWAVCSLVDHEGNLWIAGPGLYRQLGRGYVRSFTSQEGLPSELVWSTFRDRAGRLWVGTSDGLASLGPRGWTRVPGTEGLSVSALVQDPGGRLWIGSNNGIPVCLEPGATKATDQVFHRLRPEAGAILPTRSTALAFDSTGNLWLADPSHGVFRIEPGTGEIRHERLPVGGPNVHARYLRCDAQGRIWVATDAGLALCDGRGWHAMTRADGLGDEQLQGLLPMPDGSCWLMFMEARGLVRVGFKDGRFQVLERLDSSRGLASDRVYSAALDAAGTLWVGNDHGVDRVRGDQVFHLGQGAGMPGEDCSGNAIMVEPSGDVWVGTSTGLGHIIPGRQPALLQPIPVRITQVKRGKARLTPPFPDLPALSHRDATLEFHFASPTYLDERAVIYEVRLLGLEEEWRGTEVPLVRYAALPRGHYQFEVRAAYPGQVFGPVASYAVDVLGPWWSSWWFLGLCALAGLGLVTLFLRWRLRTLAHQKERLAALVDERTGDLLRANHALEEANLALRAQSLTDPLTGLHNRRFLSMVVDEDVAGVARAYRACAPGQFLPNQDLVFFLVDLDNFKQVNDTHGHPVGDQVLVKVASALRQAARETDALIRWGGEEFLIMARKSSRSEANLLAERITSIMAEQEVPLDSGEILKWTCSVGFGAYPFQLDDPAWIGWERLIEIVDACLYLAKRSGRDGWVGAAARPGLARTPHSARLPWELLELRDEGVLDLQASRPVPSKALV